MLTQAFHYWTAALRQSAIWSVALWTLVFTIILIIALFVVGAGALVTAFSHPAVAGRFPAVQAGHMITGLFVMWLILVAAGPFLAAGIYGLLSQAVLERPITWGSFWPLGRQFYGRAWGLMGFGLLWMLALALVGGVLAGLAHGVGVVITIVLALLSWPLALRMLGGLFVDGLTWTDSFRKIWGLPGYGALWGGGLVAIIAYGLLAVIDLVLIKAMGSIGLVLYMLLSLFLVVAAPLWLLAVYRATQAGRTPTA